MYGSWRACSPRWRSTRRLPRSRSGGRPQVSRSATTGALSSSSRPIPSNPRPRRKTSRDRRSALLPLLSCWTTLVPVSAMAAASEPVSTPTIAPLKLPPIVEETLPNGLSVVTVRKTDLRWWPSAWCCGPVPRWIRKGRRVGLIHCDPAAPRVRRPGAPTRSTTQSSPSAGSWAWTSATKGPPSRPPFRRSTPPRRSTYRRISPAMLPSRRTVRPGEAARARAAQAGAGRPLHGRRSRAPPVLLWEGSPVRPLAGRQHPESIKKIQRKDVVGLLSKDLQPPGSGAVLRGRHRACSRAGLARKAFSNWKGQPWTPLNIPNAAAIQGPQILLVDKPDATQAQVRVAVPGIGRSDPAYYGAIVADTVLGGGFTSRLVDEIRVNQGLSYSVSTRVVALRKGGAISYTDLHPDRHRPEDPRCLVQRTRCSWARSADRSGIRRRRCAPSRACSRCARSWDSTPTCAR